MAAGSNKVITNTTESYMLGIMIDLYVFKFLHYKIN